MKEFIDKLIGRLEEESDKWLDIWDKDRSDNYADGMNDGFDEAISIVNELAEEYKGGWISVDDRLPEKDRYVLCQGVNGQFIACIDSMDDKWRDTHFYTRSTILAWLPLPAPYKEGSE